MSIALLGQSAKVEEKPYSRLQELKIKFILPAQLPLQMLLGDNLAGHQTPRELVLSLCDQGILPVYAPLSGSWLNMAESMQRILAR